jgi:hypothetical protein
MCFAAPTAATSMEQTAVTFTFASARPVRAVIQGSYTDSEAHMALVSNLKRITKDRQSVHSEVECAYSIFTAEDGQKYVQLETFGGISCAPGRPLAGRSRAPTFL